MLKDGWRCLDDGWMDGLVDGWRDGMVDGWMDGLVDGWMDGMVDGWMGTRHVTADWFNIGNGVSQACMLSPCLFNLYAE